MLAIAIPTVVLAVLSGSLPAEQGAIELRYRGTFSKASRDAEPTGEPVKRFDLYCLSTPRNERGREPAFVLDEQGGGGWPWPARFGTISLDSSSDPPETDCVCCTSTTGPLTPWPSPFRTLSLPASSPPEPAGRPREPPSCLTKTIRRRGSIGFPLEPRSVTATVGGSTSPIIRPPESLWIAVDQPLMVKAERRFVIGRGEVHLLKVELDSVTPIKEESLVRVRRPLDGLLKLQRQLKRAEDDQSAELSEAQLKLITEQVKTLEPQAENTPFEGLVASIIRDVNSQSRRSDDVDSLARRMTGKAAP